MAPNDADDDFDGDAEVIERMAASFAAPRGSAVTLGGGRRLSRASVKFFQNETSTSTRNFSLASASSAGSTRNLVAALDGFADHGLIDSEGKVNDEYILQRQSVNRPTTLKKIPLLCDLTAAAEITQVDGWVFSMLMVSGFAKMSSRVDELNKINVFPIADGDTGANMKVCIKLPARNLLLNPSDNLLLAVSNFAADVLLNGQGNSGTILSHFFVSLAEEVRSSRKASLTVDEFAACLSRAGKKMDDAVPNPVEGTLLSVCRDACRGLDGRGPLKTLDALLSTWNDVAQEQLAKTPEQLVVEGVRVLEEAGVVDSGAQGFVYLVEGMKLASEGALPNAMDAKMFATAEFMVVEEGSKSIDVDHTLCDSKYRWCTEAVVLLKDGVNAQTVIDDIQKAANEDGIGDSIATVKGPAKGGGDLVKIHIHAQDPSVFFDRLKPYSRDPVFKKEKVEDMLVMREVMHGEKAVDLGDAKFSIMGLCSIVLPPLEDMEELHTLPVFMVPATTQEPIDVRFVSDTDTCIALNHQRHKDTAVKYTTAASNPMQLKIEILAALSKGKPLIIFLMSMDKRVSALGRNTVAAIEMLEPEQKAMVKVLAHGWGFYEAPFIMEAIRCAQRGETIEEAFAASKRVGDYNFSFSNFVTSDTVRRFMAWRPGLFPKGFSVEDNSFVAFGIPVTVRDEVLSDFQRVGMLMTVQNKALTMEELHDAEAARVKKDMKPGEKLTKILVQSTGRPDFGYKYIDKLRAVNVPMSDDILISVYNGSFFSVAGSSWGEMVVMYVVE